MAIFRPGQRYRYHRILGKKGAKRDLTVVLSLTAMVDMFTVLVIFLLQNYNTTGEILYIPKEVTLPQAHEVKELPPAIVVTVSKKEVLIDRDAILKYSDLSKSEGIVNPVLLKKMKLALVQAKEDYQNKLQNRLREVVQNAKGEDQEFSTSWNRVTLQADKDVDLASIKKVMGTITEAGAGQINFAVTKQQVKE